MKLVSGLNVMVNKTHNFKVMSDLLGADWWLDIDQFAERDFSDDNYIQNDIKHPNRVIKEGDTFGYDYISNITNSDIFAQIEGKFSKFDFFGGVDLKYTEFWRTGNTTNGKFVFNSGGNSDKQRFLDYAVKVGTTYKITSKHFLLLNAEFLTRAPYFNDAYISPRTRDFLISDINGKKLESEKIISADLSYIFRSQIVMFKVLGYYTEFFDGIQNTSFYHDELRTFVNYVMTDVNERHYGGEFGMDIKASQTINVTGAFGYGRYLYSSRPSVTIAQDNSSEILVTDKTVYIKNYHVGGMPELAANIGMRYNAPKYWYIGFDANYFDEIYVTLNPERRTVESLQGLYVNDSQVDEILNQEKLKGGFTLNVFGGKSWRIKQYSFGFSVSINNVLNNKKFAISGFEQYRFDRTNINKFPAKYTYMYGINYFVNLFFRF
ncbi:MAG: hypothetical protein LBV69_01565 [Bacteroidales bacterium]|nr:hypothetical protein [Bacteroidales bacterium]